MIRRCALFVATLPLAWGCADVAVPRILHPGPEELQRARAERFDPYPLTDVGPNVVGGRPLQFIRPAPENERAQNDMAYEERFHQPPPPGLYKAPRAPKARQAVTYVPGAPLPAAPAYQNPPLLENAPPFSP